MPSPNRTVKVKLTNAFSDGALREVELELDTTVEALAKQLGIDLKGASVRLQTPNGQTYTVAAGEAATTKIAAGSTVAVQPANVQGA